jgi:hypothetical protein
MNRVTVPVLKLEGIDTIRSGTAIAVSLGFAWVLWKLVGVMLKFEKPVLKKIAPKRSKQTKKA